jgi:hypothetical protein
MKTHISTVRIADMVNGYFKTPFPSSTFAHADIKYISLKG